MLTRERLRKIMTQVGKETKTDFRTVVQLKDKTIRNALSGYAKGCRREDVIGLYDTTVFSSGKNGVLLSVDSLYSSEFPRFPRRTGGITKLPLAGLCRVEKGGTNNAFLTVDYQDGSQRVVYVGNVYDKPIIGILEGILAQAAAPAEPDVPEQPAPIVTGPAARKRAKAPAPAEKVKTDLTFEEIVQEAMAQEGPAPQTPPPVQEEPQERRPQTPPPGEPAAEVPAGEAPYQAGLALYRQGKELEALPLLVQAAEQGVLRAQLLCASIYDEEAEDEQALHWYLAAAKQGDIKAQFRCATMYGEGEGTEIDLKQALYWYLQAAQQGHEEAQLYCGIMYDKGLGTESDKAEALRWYRRAARQGEVEAQLRCAAIYADRKDFSAALPWYLAAAEQGHPEAQYRCGILYDGGLGTPVDKEAALGWYLKAAQQGVADAQVSCGVLYMNGEGTEMDWEKARIWFQRAADQGDEGALMLLEDCF